MSLPIPEVQTVPTRSLAQLREVSATTVFTRLTISGAPKQPNVGIMRSRPDEEWSWKKKKNKKSFSVELKTNRLVINVALSIQTYYSTGQVRVVKAMTCVVLQELTGNPRFSRWSLGSLPEEKRRQKRYMCSQEHRVNCGPMSLVVKTSKHVRVGRWPGLDNYDLSWLRPLKTENHKKSYCSMTFMMVASLFREKRPKSKREGESQSVDCWEA